MAEEDFDPLDPVVILFVRVLTHKFSHTSHLSTTPSHFLTIKTSLCHPSKALTLSNWALTIILSRVEKCKPGLRLFSFGNLFLVNGRKKKRKEKEKSPTAEGTTAEDTIEDYSLKEEPWFDKV